MPNIRRAAKIALFLAMTLLSNFAWAGPKGADAAALLAKEGDPALRGKWAPISNDWEFYKSELLQPYDFYPEKKVAAGKKISLPFKFERNVNYGTFHCRVNGLRPNKNYATEIYGAVISCCRFWCNGKLVATSGFLSKDSRAARSGDLCEIIELNTDANGSLDILIHVADYENAARGIVKPLMMTERTNAEQKMFLRYFFNALLVAFLIAHIIYNLTLFVLTAKRRSPLILAILFTLLTASVTLTGFSLTQTLLTNIPYVSHRRLPVSLFCLEAALLVLYESSLFKIPYKKSIVLHIAMAINAAAVFAIPPALFEKAHFFFSAIAIAGVMYAVSVPNDFTIRMKFGEKTSESVRNHLLRLLRTLAVFAIVIACSNDFLAAANKNTVVHPYFFFKLSILVFGIMECVVYAFNRNWTLSRVNRYSEALAKDNEILGKFVPGQILKLMGASDVTRIIPGECRIIDAIIFCAQIKHYSQLAESIGRSELFKITTEFHQSISPIIIDSGGFITKRDAGGFTAIFQQKNSDTIVCAARVQKKLRDIRRSLRKKHRTDIGIGIAIHSGKVAIGTMGTHSRLDATALSDDITLANAVAEQNAKMNSQILITEEAMPFCRSYIDYMYEGHFFIFEGKQILVYSAMPIIKSETAYEDTLEVIDDDDEN